MRGRRRLRGDQQAFDVFDLLDGCTPMKFLRLSLAAESQPLRLAIVTVACFAHGHTNNWNARGVRGFACTGCAGGCAQAEGTVRSAGLPVIVVMPSPKSSTTLHAKLLSNIREIRARGATQHLAVRVVAGETFTCLESARVCAVAKYVGNVLVRTAVSRHGRRTSVGARSSRKPLSATWLGRGSART
jgi:hypothetical protein